MKRLVNSCIRKMDKIGMRRSRKPCAARPREGWRHAVLKSSQHEKKPRKKIKMHHCVGDLMNQDHQLEEKS